MKINNRKRRKLKRGFKMFLFLFFILSLITTLFILSKDKVINLNKPYNAIVSLFKKKTETPKQVEGETLDEFSSLFKVRLPSKGFEYASSSKVGESGDMKIYLKNTENDSGYLYVNTEDKANYIWITFISSIEAEPLKTEIKNNFYKLDYIDLRFSNKIFYKFKDKSLNLYDANAPQGDTQSSSSTASSQETSSSSSSTVRDPFVNSSPQTLLIQEASSSSVNTIH